MQVDPIHGSSSPNKEASPTNSAGQPNWLELAKISLDNFKSLRELEWKILFGHWTAVGALTYLVLEKKIIIDRCPLGAIYTVSWLAVSAKLFLIQWSSAESRGYWSWYMQNADNTRKQKKPIHKGKELKEEDVLGPDTSWTWKTYVWLASQIIATAALLFASWWLITSVKPDK